MTESESTPKPAPTPEPLTTPAAIEVLPDEQKPKNIFLRELCRPSNLIALGALGLAIYVQVHTHLQMKQAALDNEQWQAEFDERIASSNAEMIKVQQAGDFMIAQGDLRMDIDQARRLGVSDLTAFTQLTVSAEKYQIQLEKAESPTLADELMLANAYALLGKREQATALFRSIGQRYGEADDWLAATKSIYGAMMLNVGYAQEFAPIMTQAKAAAQQLDANLRLQFQVQIYAFTAMHHAKLNQMQESSTALKEWIKIAHPSQASTYWMVEESLTDDQRTALEQELYALSEKAID